MALPRVRGGQDRLTCGGALQGRRPLSDKLPKVASSTVNVPRLVVDPTFVARLQSIVVADAARQATQILERIPAELLARGESGDYYYPLENIQRDAAGGGRWAWREFSVTDREGTKWDSSIRSHDADRKPVESEMLARLENYARISLTIEWGAGVGTNARSISVSIWDAYSRSIVINADDDAIISLRSEVVALVGEFSEPEPESRAPVPFNIFIGHGGDRKWEAVRDYIAAAGFEVEAFESDDRSSRATLEVVEQMITNAAVAVIVMTGADRAGDRLLARQNVVHELGFAQGRLGVQNTIILLEDGTEQFSNIAGMTQIRFRPGEAHTTKDEVLAALANRQRRRQALDPRN